ncbi:hypothetical protein R6Q57_023248 [Mikania cordata]
MRQIGGERMSVKSAGNLSTLFDVGGIVGGILAGYISDKLKARATTAASFMYAAIPSMLLYRSYGSISKTINIILMIIAGLFVNGPYALITTAVSADLGTHSSLKGDSRALATVTAIIDGTGSIGAALGPLLTGFLSTKGWDAVFAMLMIGACIAGLLLSRLVCSELTDITTSNSPRGMNNARVQAPLSQSLLREGSRQSISFSNVRHSPIRYPERTSSHRRSRNRRPLYCSCSAQIGGSIVGVGAGGFVTDRRNVIDSVQEWLEGSGCNWSRIAIKTDNGREIRSFTFKDEDQTQEVRAVERKTLLETLAKQLPQDSICFSSKLGRIEKDKDGGILLELDNGTQISSKLVIGCDGIHSAVAKWMGFSEPKYAGYCAFRGLGDYPDGQPFGPRVNYIYGRGIRAAYVPVSTTKVYWFVCFNSPPPGPKITDPLELKKQSKDLIKTWDCELQSIVDATPDDTIILTPLSDRWLWPGFSPSASSGGAVVVGDAWHPMTPNLGQGACCALEDAVVLVKKLAPVLDAGPMAIEDALRSYQNERLPRLYPMTIRSNLIGAILQMDNSMVCSLRDNVLIPKLVRLGSMLGHTNFEFEPLPQTNV